MSAISTLAARGKSPAGRVASVVGPDARRADRGDAGSSSRRRYTGDGSTPPQLEGHQRFVVTGRRCSSSPMPEGIDFSLCLARATTDPWRANPRDFYHGLLWVSD